MAIVSVNEDYLKRWAQKEGKNLETMKEPEILQIVKDDMIREGKKRNLMSYEQVNAIEWIKEPFTIENGLLTPTLKNRRYAIEKKYKDLFDSLYKKLESQK